jgi:hypothetical protein
MVAEEEGEGRTFLGGENWRGKIDQDESDCACRSSLNLAIAQPPSELSSQQTDIVTRLLISSLRQTLVSD